MSDRIVGGIREALAGLCNGASVMISGFGGAGIPVALMAGMESSDATDLTVIINSLRYLHTYAPGLFGERRIRSAICSAARSRGRDSAPYEQQAFEGDLDVEIVPQGTFAERIRAGGAGIPAFFTPTGFGTALTQGKESREFQGKVCVLEHAITADFALVRAHVADHFGNVVFRGSQANFGPAMAAAARTTVVEVSRVSDVPLDPHRIDVPGIYVDRVIALPDRP